MPSKEQLARDIIDHLKGFWSLTHPAGAQWEKMQKLVEQYDAAPDEDTSTLRREALVRHEETINLPGYANVAKLAEDARQMAERSPYVEES
jgi:hypothetical protein